MRSLPHSNSDILTGTESQSLESQHIAISSLLHSQAAFFAFGNSNAISSIDLSNAYNGISGYNVLAVALLLFAGNWAGPIWWTSAGIAYSSCRTEPERPAKSKTKQHLDSQKSNEILLAESRKTPSRALSDDDKTSSSTFRIFVTVYTMFFAGALLSIMAACFMLREHLFIWSVFSPKYLYMMAWIIAFHVVTCASIGSVSLFLKWA